MGDFKRNYLPGGTYFFTLVTYRRRPILTSELGRRSLRFAIRKIRVSYPFSVFAVVLLPDHLHLVMTLPSGDSDYSTRWKRIKEEFTRHWRDHGGGESTVTASEAKRGRRGIWQPRYWEHTVRDESDLEHCVDYIHWNPRKHGLVRRVRDWPWSSFFRFVGEGQYDLDWGGTSPEGVNMRGWGEPAP